MNLLSLFSTNQLNPESTEMVQSGGKFIPWSDASYLISKYNDHSEKIQIPIDGRIRILHGFSVDKEKIQPIIDHPETDRVFIALAYHDGILDPLQPAGFSTIYIGMDENDALLFDETKGHKILNYCDPCPRKCPTNVDLDSL